MATPSTNPKSPTPGGGKLAIDAPWLWVLSFVGLAVAWKTWPGGHLYIGIFAGLIFFALWVTRGGMITSQVSNIVSGKVP